MKSIILVTAAAADITFNSVVNKGKFELSEDTLYRWPDEGYEITDSKDAWLELKYGVNGQTSDVKTRLQYWTREKKNKETDMVFHEFHVKCIFENLDVSSFTSTDKLECRIGVQRTIPALRDWSVAEMPVVDAATDVDTAISGWKCIDTHQFET